MKTIYSLYDNNLTFFYPLYRNSWIISVYHDKRLCFKLNIKLLIQTGPYCTIDVCVVIFCLWSYWLGSFCDLALVASSNYNGIAESIKLEIRSYNVRHPLISHNFKMLEFMKYNCILKFTLVILRTLFSLIRILAQVLVNPIVVESSMLKVPFNWITAWVPCSPRLRHLVLRKDRSPFFLFLRLHQWLHSPISLSQSYQVIS